MIMKKILVRTSFILFALAASVAVAPAQERAPMLVTPAWLAEHLHDSNLVLLHVGAKGEFEQAHIPGAQPLLYSDDISTPHDMSNGHMAAGTLMLELPPVEQLKATFEKKGVSDNSRIIVYFGKDWYSPTTRTILTLTYLGLGDRTSLLDGGIPAWQAAGHPVTAEVKTPAPGHLTPHVHPEVVVDAAWVSSHLHQPAVAIIDARNTQFYTGKNSGGMPRAGHIPGAQSIPFDSLFGSDGKLKDTSALTEIFRGAGVKPGAQVVSYCHIGQQATVIWFAARLLGYEAHLYDGSWDDWSQRKDLPIETSPEK
jgi:thiosulfate/3-mercaptopyruvate sulfurtransferase